MASIYNFLLRLDGVIYDLIDYLYDIFNYLAKLNLFSNEDYTKIVSRIYIVLGMIMLFVLAYSLLRAVINPDDFAKGEHSFPKLIQNIIVSLIIIAVLPTVFTVAFNIQNSILNNDTIPKLILGTDGYDETMKSDAGRSMAYYTFKAFFHPNEEWCISKGYISGAGATDAELLTCSEKIKGNGWIGLQNGDPLSTVDEPIRTGERSFIGYNQFGEAVEEGEITYYCLISSVAGIFLLYVLLNFCFDMAVRVVKLMFFQIIAPIPVVCRVIPFGGMKDVFSKWTKNTVSTFVEVFIRIAIMYLGVFLITDIVIPNLGPALAVSGLSFSQRLIVQALVIMGVIIFVKQAPKLIGDMFGLDSGSMKLGLMDKLAMGGGLMAGAAAGGLAIGSIRNFAKTKRSGKSTGAALKSAFAGGLSSATRSAYGARGAKNFSDMKNATSKGLAGAAKARDDRIKYKAKHPDGVLSGHAEDFADWLTGRGVEDLDYVINSASDINKANDDFRNAVKKQWDKHSTDAAIVADMSLDNFKGDDKEKLFQLYSQYKGYSAATIRQDIEQRRERSRNTNYTEMARQKLGDNLPKKEDFYSSILDSNGNRTFNETAYKNAVDNYNQQVSDMARQMSLDAANEISYLDSMYSQLEKESITRLGQLALDGKGIGTIDAKDLYTAKQIGINAQDIIRNSGLDLIDPSTGEVVAVKDNNYAKFIDDVASAASKQSDDARREKQKYLDKKKNS